MLQGIPVPIYVLASGGTFGKRYNPMLGVVSVTNSVSSYRDLPARLISFGTCCEGSIPAASIFTQASCLMVSHNALSAASCVHHLSILVKTIGNSRSSHDEIGAMLCCS